MGKGGIGALIERKKRKELVPVANTKTTSSKAKPAKGKGKGLKRSKSTPGLKRYKSALGLDAATKMESSFSATSQNDDDAPKAKPCKESQLELQPWFFGTIPREEAGGKLKTEGAFLCRLTQDAKGAEAIILSIVAPGGNIVHCPINVLGTGAARTFAMDADCHESVHALVSFYIRAKEPVCKGTDVVLKNGVRRPAFWLRSSSVKETKVVGQGRFGDVSGCNVHVASETEDDKMGKWVEAQLKKSRANATDDDRLALAREAKTLKSLGKQDFIVNLIGLVADKLPMGLVLELPGEQLSGRIAKGTLTDPRRLQLLFELTTVAEFLAAKRILHRCIRAANCYLGPTSQLRLSEFSWAKHGRSYRTWPSEEKVPSGMGRWSAPESLTRGEFGPESEMWCVGVVGWELWASGAEPWPFNDDAAVEAKLRGGERLSTVAMVTVAGLGPALQCCWDATAANRPAAAAFKLQLAQIQKTVGTAQPAYLGAP